MNCKRLFSYIAIVLFSVCADATFKISNAQSQPSLSTSISHHKPQRYVLSAAETRLVKKGVLGLLNHPKTARIRQIAAVKGQESVTVCGYVTAKNLSNKFEGHIANKGYVLFIGSLFSRGFVMTGVAIGDQAKLVTRTCNEDVFQ